MEMRFPEVGSWFRAVEGGTFEVIAVDEDERTIDIQHFDGTLEELDLEAWTELAAEPIDPPEDWTGALDLDDEDTPDDGEPRRDWDDPLDFVDENDELL